MCFRASWRALKLPPLLWTHWTTASYNSNIRAFIKLKKFSKNILQFDLYWSFTDKLKCSADQNRKYYCREIIPWNTWFSLNLLLAHSQLKKFNEPGIKIVDGWPFFNPLPELKFGFSFYTYGTSSWIERTNIYSRGFFTYLGFCWIWCLIFSHPETR